MRVLFILKGLALVRHFDATLLHLAENGHHVILAPMKLGYEDLLPQALATHANCDVLFASAKRTESAHTATVLRQAHDYLRYYEPALTQASANRRRALTHLLRTVSDGTRELSGDTPDLPLSLNATEVRRLRKLFDEVEKILPPATLIEEFISAQRPDVMLITPLVTFGGLQSDYVKAARRLRIPSGCPVFSWDNLSNKGVMHEHPDRTFVWNDLQRQEAIDLHGVDRKTIVVTGAPRFDPFFQRTPSQTREDFCRGLGLNPVFPLVVYLGSSPIVSPHEPAFAERWIEALRQASLPKLQDAQVLIRPHPRAKPVWNEHPRFAKKAPLNQRFPGVAVTDAKTATGDQALFDALFHSDAVVGLNTTAELEAGLLGKPVYTIRATKFADGQTGSHHFQYLLQDHGGFVVCADTIEQHLRQLADGLEGRFDPEKIRTFVQQFLRPRGADTPVSPLLADEIEQLVTAAHGRPEASSGNEMAATGPDVSPPARDASVLEHQPAQTEMSDAAQMGKSTKTRVVYDKHPLFIYVSTRAERDWRLDPGKKEPWTVSWFDDNVRPGDVIYDIGANVGVFSLIAAANLNGSGTVVAFEPGYASFARLCENIRLNRFTRLIVPMPVPLSDRTGLQRFRYRSMEPGDSRHRFSGRKWDPTDAKAKSSEQPVLGISLEQAVRDFGFPAPTLVKLDVDGAENLVLQGAGSLLSNYSLRSVILEMDPDIEDELINILQRSGLQLVQRFKRKKKPGPSYGEFRR